MFVSRFPKAQLRKKENPIRLLNASGNVNTDKFFVAIFFGFLVLLVFWEHCSGFLSNRLRRLF